MSLEHLVMLKNTSKEAHQRELGPTLRSSQGPKLFGTLVNDQIMIALDYNPR